MKKFFLVSGVLEALATLFFLSVFLKDLRLGAGPLMALCCAIGWGLLGGFSNMFRDLKRPLWDAAEQLPLPIRKKFRWSYGIMLLLLAVYSISAVVFLMPQNNLAGLLICLLFFIPLVGMPGLLKVKFVFACLLQLHAPKETQTSAEPIEENR